MIFFNWENAIDSYRIEEYIRIARFNNGWDIKSTRVSSFYFKSFKEFGFFNLASSTSQDELDDATFATKEEALENYNQFKSKKKGRE